MMKRMIVMRIVMMMIALFKWSVEWVSFLHVTQERDKGM